MLIIDQELVMIIVQYLTQIYGSFTVEILSWLVVSQLMFDRVQDKPARLPRLQQSSSLV